MVLRERTAFSVTSQTAVAKQIGFAVGNLRNALKQNDEEALNDIRVGIRRLRIMECLALFVGEAVLTDEPNAGWLYIPGNSGDVILFEDRDDSDPVVAKIEFERLTRRPVFSCRSVSGDVGECLIHQGLKSWFIRLLLNLGCGETVSSSRLMPEAAKQISSVLSDSQLLLRTLTMRSLADPSANFAHHNFVPIRNATRRANIFDGCRCAIPPHFFARQRPPAPDLSSDSL